MVENLHFWHNKHGNHGHCAFKGSAIKIVPILPTNRCNRAHFCAFIIVPIVPWSTRIVPFSNSNICVLPLLVLSCASISPQSGIFFVLTPCLSNTNYHYKNVGPWDAIKVPNIMQKKGRNTSVHWYRKEEGTKLASKTQTCLHITC